MASSPDEIKNIDNHSRIIVARHFVRNMKSLNHSESFLTKYEKINTKLDGLEELREKLKRKVFPCNEKKKKKRKKLIIILRRKRKA